MAKEPEEDVLKGGMMCDYLAGRKFYVCSTLWDHTFPEALERAIEMYKTLHGGEPTIVLLHPDDAPDLEIPEGMEVLRRPHIPPGEVWIG